MSGSFGFATGVNISRIRFLGVNSSPKQIIVDGKITGASRVSYDSANKVLDVSIGKPFVKGFSVRYSTLKRKWDLVCALIKKLFNSNWKSFLEFFFLTASSCCSAFFISLCCYLPVWHPTAVFMKSVYTSTLHNYLSRWHIGIMIISNPFTANAIVWEQYHVEIWTSLPLVHIIPR